MSACTQAAVGQQVADTEEHADSSTSAWPGNPNTGQALAVSRRMRMRGTVMAALTGRSPPAPPQVLRVLQAGGAAAGAQV